MSAATTLLPPDGQYRLTVEQYHKMIDDGILTEDDPVELLEGMLVFKTPKNEPHIASVRRCRRAFDTILPDSFFYDSQDPVTLSDGEPEPDGMVVRGSIDDFDSSKPQPSDLLLIVEVADSSLACDRGTKLRSYARARIVCYWIVNLVDRQLEVYTQPDASAEIPTYRSAEIFKPADAVPFKIGDQTIAAIRVSDLLPTV